jgi:hypothetical protein
MRIARALLGALLPAVLVAGCGAGGAPSTAEPIGDYPRYSTVAELFEQAGLVVEGTAGDREGREYEGLPYNVWPITITRAWKGDLTEGAVVEVKRPRQEDEQLDEDRGYLLFLETYPDVPGVPASTLNRDQGTYPLDASGAPTSLSTNEIRVTVADLRRLSTRGG